MRRAAMLVAAAAVLLGTTHLSAQTPNFAGKWTMVPDPNAPATGGRGGGGGGLGPEVTIAQDGKTLTTVRTTQAGDVKTVYNLDGSDSKNMVAGRQGGAATEVVSHAKWDSSKVVITTTRDFNGTSMTTTMTLSLDTAGNLLVTSTQPGRNGGDPTTTVRTYKKG